MSGQAKNCVSLHHLGRSSCQPLRPIRLVACSDNRQASSAIGYRGMVCEPAAGVRADLHEKLLLKAAGGLVSGPLKHVSISNTAKMT